jgi:biotin transport system substrate-specific component
MSSTAIARRTIADALIPGEGATRDALLVTGGSVLTAICAQITIPWQPVPFTLQTLSVMLCGLALGAKRGAASQLLYVLIGGVGLPVFAHGQHGATVLFGSTGGYLLSFAVVAAVLGRLAETGWTRSVWKTSAAMVIGSAVVLTCGAAWLSAYIGGQAAIAGGVTPFIIPEIMKAVVVIVALPSAWAVVGRR